MLITPFDKSVIAAYGLSNRINSLIFAVPNALGSVTITIVAQNLTSGNEDRNKKTILLSHIISFILGAILLMVLYVFHEDIISLFSKDPAVIKETIRAQRLYSHTVFSWAVMQITMGVFYASGYSFIPIIIGVARLFVFRIPTLYLLITFTNLGADSIWYCMLIANNLAGILSLIFLFTINWRKPPKYLNLQQEKQSA